MGDLLKPVSAQSPVGNDPSKPLSERYKPWRFCDSCPPRMGSIEPTNLFELKNNTSIKRCEQSGLNESLKVIKYVPKLLMLPIQLANEPVKRFWNKWSCFNFIRFERSGTCPVNAFAPKLKTTSQRKKSSESQETNRSLRIQQKLTEITQTWNLSWDATNERVILSRGVFQGFHATKFSGNRTCKAIHVKVEGDWIQCVSDAICSTTIDSLHTHSYLSGVLLSLGWFQSKHSCPNINIQAFASSLFDQWASLRICCCWAPNIECQFVTAAV